VRRACRCRHWGLSLAHAASMAQGALQRYGAQKSPLSGDRRLQAIAPEGGSEHRSAAERAQRITAALTLPLVEARDQRTGRSIGLLDRRSAVRIAAHARANLLHP